MDTPPKLKIKLTLRPAPTFRPSTSTIQQSSDVNQAPNFTVFGRLAIEMQLLIWEQAAKVARVVRIYNAHIVLAYGSGQIDSSSNIIANCSIPALLHVCHQSRKVGLKAYQLIPKGYCEDPFYINPDVDAILMRGTSELFALWRNYRYWFPERRRGRAFEQKLPLLIFDPSHGSDAGLCPKDPNYNRRADIDPIIHPMQSSLVTRVLFCFERVVILKPPVDAPVYDKAYCEYFTHMFWTDMKEVASVIGPRPKLLKMSPRWIKDRVNQWSQVRFKKLLKSGNWDQDHECKSYLKWHISE